ncbi:hypothetical protein ACQEVF_07690 [Nonomuraea polychroma]|uniref:hypothetical protein n=1 Tax=Nonomuraea polychroma TaxID=46176 RepID=UPI003D8B5C6B
MNERRAGIGRVTAAIIAIAAMLPYLTLKILWLTGGSIGVTDPALMRDPSMIVANAATFGLEFVGLVLALGLAMRWGMRLPAWLVLLPLWVGTGLLFQIALTTPLVLLMSGATVFTGAGPIQPWVYLMVYGGFITQGVALMAAFAFYARDRWPGVFTTRLDHPFASPTRPFQIVVARGALLVATVVGGVRIFSAFAGTPVAEGVQNGVKGVIAIAGAAAFLVLVERRGSGPFWRPLVVAWLGSGALFANSLYIMIISIGEGPLGSGGAGHADLFGMLTGLVMGMCGAFLLAERSGVGHVEPAQHPLEGEDREGDRTTADHGHR